MLSFPAASKTLTTCLDYEPYTVNPDGTILWAGRNIEMLSHLATQLSLELDMSIRAPFTRCLSLLKSGKIDVLTSLIYTKERAKYFHMLPYANRGQLAVFFRKENTDNRDPYSLLPQQTIGMHRAFSLPNHVKESSLFRHIIPIKTVDDGFKMALKGRIDGVLATVSTGEAILKVWPELDGKFSYVPLDTAQEDKINLGISKKSPFALKLKTLSKAISSLAVEPTLSHLNLTISSLPARQPRQNLIENQ